MLQKSIVLITCLLTFSFALMGQSTTISGTVTEQGKPVGEVIITISDTSNRQIAYCFSDSQGRYSVQFNSKSDSVVLGLGAFNMKPQTHRLPNQTQVQNYSVTLSAFDIKEVFVSAPKVYSKGDTINYSVEKLVKITDANIEDLLKRLPGIKVLKTGEILYNNETISHFYVEGLDLMEGRYTMVSQRVQPKMVETVQVLENHQPIKALRDINFENKAAINLKLRPEVRSILKLSTKVGGGVEQPDLPLWLAELTAMQLSNASQILTGVEVNNVGKETSVKSDLTNPSSSAELLYSNSISNPPIATELYRQNQDATAHFSTVKKANEKWQLRLNAIYQHTDDHAEGERKATYPSISGDTTSYLQTSNVHSWSDYAFVSLDATQNSNDLYMKHQLEGSLHFNEGSTALGFDSLNTLENILVRSYHLKGHTYVVNSKRGFELNVNANIKKSPQTLSFSDVPSNFVGLNLLSNAIQQQVDYSSSSISILGNSLREKKWHSWTLNPTFSIKASLESLTSDLDLSLGASIPDTLQNRLNMGKALANAGLSLLYDSRKFEVRIDLLAGAELHIARGKLPVDTTFNKLMPALYPYFSLRYKPKYNIMLNASYFLSYSLPNASDLYGGCMLNSYQNLSRYNMSLPMSIRQSVQFEASHRRAVDMIFQKMTLFYSHTHKQSMERCVFSGLLTQNEVVFRRNQRYSYGGSYSFSKGFSEPDGKLDLDFTYNHQKSSILVSSTIADQHSEVIGVKESLFLNPIKWLLIEQSTAYSYNQSSIDNQFDYISARFMQNYLKIGVTLPCGLLTEFNVSNYFGKMQQNSYNFWLPNLSIAYRWYRYHFSLKWNNITNTNFFESTNVTALYNSYTLQKIRGSSVLLSVFIELN